MTLEGYGAGTCLCGFLETFWGLQKVVPRQNGFPIPTFPATRGATQGRLVPLTIFNVVVGNFIITCLSMAV